MINTVPRQLRLFSDILNGDAVWRDIGEPLEMQDGEPSGGEALEVSWWEPTNWFTSRKFYVGHDIFLDGAVSNTPITAIPEDQLIACYSMALVLENVHVGTWAAKNLLDANQEDKWLNSILREIQVKDIVIVDDPDPAKDGNLYKITFNRKGQSNNTKEVCSDFNTLSQYANRNTSYAISVNCVPASISAWGHDNGNGYIEPGDLGAEGSQLRDDIVAFLKDRRFYA